jgi:hypothetical protein
VSSSGYYGVIFFGGRPLGLGGIIEFFWGEEDIDYLEFLLWDRQYLRDLSKNDFFEILLIFSGCAKNLDNFSILGNQLEPIERSSWSQ